MITLLTGENSFEIEQALNEIAAKFDGVVERIDGGQLQLNQLPDIMMGVSLFATARAVIIRGLSENKVVWPVLNDWLPRISDDIHLVLVEPKPDKRTVGFRALQKVAKVQEFSIWTERDVQKAKEWVANEAKKQGINLSTKVVQLIVSRVGVDQWQLYFALQKLKFIDDITVDSVKNIIDANPNENVFNLLETAINGDISELKKVIKNLEVSEDVYRLSALIFSQVFQLAVISSAEITDNPAKDFGINPYTISKMKPLVKQLSKSKISKIVKIFAACDDDMKISRAEPWLLLERALINVAKI